MNMRRLIITKNDPIQIETDSFVGPPKKYGEYVGEIITKITSKINHVIVNFSHFLNVLLEMKNVKNTAIK